MSQPITDPYDFAAGESPLLVSFPHSGTGLTPAVAAGLTDCGRSLGDTDWHAPELYGFLRGHDASLLLARYSRYVIDLNRPADDTPLYSGATTGLFPDINFDGEPLFETGAAPSPEERQRYLDEIWQPYHQCIRAALEEIRERHGYAVLFDVHTIRSQVPRLFEGQLPDLNLGTADGTSCDPALAQQLQEVLESSPFTTVVNGRFKGGYITRQYGEPERNIHAVQLELAQRNYMVEEPPFDYRPERAETLQPVLQRFVGALLDW